MRDVVHHVDDLIEPLEDQVMGTRVAVSDTERRLRDELAAQIQRLKKHIDTQHGELDCLRRQIDNRQPDFPQYGHLPAEIRAIIWDRSLSRRLLTVEDSRARPVSISIFTTAVTTCDH